VADDSRLDWRREYGIRALPEQPAFTVAADTRARIGAANTNGEIVKRKLWAPLVRVHHVRMSVTQRAVHLLHSILRPAARSITIGTVAQIRFEDRALGQNL
jgi:hypothetical protein